MKPLKFRAWVEGETSTVCPLYAVQFDDDAQRIQSVDIVIDMDKRIVFHTSKMESVHLIQFVGLLDKHGKEVYKDDILRIEASATGIVIEGRGGFIIAFADGHRLSFEDVASECIEVVGNIYETKKEQG